ncbi:MAG: TRAP transporter substrate-binding protein [Peptococcaceae bacterium]
MKNKRKIGLMILMVLLSGMLILAGCGKNTDTEAKGQTEEPQKITFKITHGVGTDSVFHHASEKFKELAEEYSQGQIDVQIYPGGQIGSGNKSVQDIQSGIIQATIESVNNISPFAPTFGVFDLPYFVNNSEEFNKVVAEMNDELNEKIFQESGLKTITWFEQGPRVLGTNGRAVKTLADLKGLKIRVPKNPMMLGAFASWGVNATPIAWDETINAVQQGVIDGLELPYGDFYSTNLDEIIDYITEIHYKYDVCAIVVKDEWLQSQPENVQNALIRAGEETTEWIKGFTQDFIEKAKREMEVNVTLNPTPEDERVWEEKAKADWPTYYEKVGGRDTVAKAMEVLGKQLP